MNKKLNITFLIMMIVIGILGSLRILYNDSITYKDPEPLYYPNATVITRYTDDLGKRVIAFDSTDEVAQIFDFYVKYLPTQGWKITMPVIDKQGAFIKCIWIYNARPYALFVDIIPKDERNRVELILDFGGGDLTWGTDVWLK